MGIFGGIIGGVGSVVQGLINARQENRNITAQNQANMMLTKTQNDFNQQMWNQQNEYNSPRSQMQRFIDAGLNPNLIYERGSSGISTAAPVKQAPEINARRIQPVNLPDMLSQYQNFALKQAQTNNLREQGEILKNQVLLKAFETSDYWKEFGLKWGDYRLGRKMGDIDLYKESPRGKLFDSQLMRSQMDAMSSKQRADMNEITLKYMRMG